MTETQSKFISLDERAYRYIRQFTIKSVNDALIELITNVDDAYKKTEYDPKILDIDIINPNIIKVRDRAIGLTSEGLQKCFLQVGNFTASDTSRGFFSRGAKDITALGNITFSTIRDNKFSQCTLDSNVYGQILVADIDATEEHRQKYKIPEGHNGLEVSIELLSSFQNVNAEDVFNSISKIAVLRDIISDSKNIIVMREYSNEVAIFERQVTYTYPQSTMLLDMEYIIPNYPDHKARFVVYKANAPIDQPKKENEAEFGFLIKDSTSIYEVNTIQDRFRWNPYMNFLYGYVYCDSIHSFLLDYDVNGTSNENPYPILDPSRVTGINKQHPFIINLLSIPSVRLDMILRELNKSMSSKMVSINDMQDLVKELQNFGVDLTQQRDIKVSFVPTYDQKLATAVADSRAKYVTYEKSHVLNNQYDTQEVIIDNYVRDELLKLDPEPNSMFIYDDKSKGLYQIINRTQTTEKLDPISILALIPTDMMDSLRKNPYVYSLTDPTSDTKERNMEKMYIFEKGTLEKNEKGLVFTQPNKIFNIVFFEDINISQRYLVDYTDGILIQINLHNPIVRKYLVSDVSKLGANINVSVITSTKSVVFMKEMMTDIIVDIICENDIRVGKIILDADNFTNGKKVIDYRNKIVTQIELPIDSLFDKMIENAKTDKLKKITDVISQISDAVSTLLGDSMPSALTNMKTDLITTLTSTVE